MKKLKDSSKKYLELLFVAALCFTALGLFNPDFIEATGANLRKLLLYDLTGKDLLFTTDSNIPIELLDSNGLNLDLTTESNVPVALKDANGLDLELTAQSNVPIELVDSNGLNLDLTASSNAPVSIEEFSAAVSTTMAAFTDNLEGENVLNTAAVMFGRVDNDTLVPIKVDGSTQDIQMIEQEHSEIHSGDHYTITQVPTLSINNVRDVRITTPNTAKWGHLVLALEPQSETAWFFHEVAVITLAGTAQTPINNNRNSVNTAGVTFDYIDNTSVALANDDTDISGGTEMYCGIIGSGRGSLGAATRSRELVLKQNTIYNLRVIANAAGYVNIDFEWYEHTDKN
jgi:hypothetical protein